MLNTDECTFLPSEFTVLLEKQAVCQKSSCASERLDERRSFHSPLTSKKRWDEGCGLKPTQVDSEGEAAHSTLDKACAPGFLQGPGGEAHSGVLPKLQMWNVHPYPHCPGSQSEETMFTATCF